MQLNKQKAALLLLALALLSGSMMAGCDAKPKASGPPPVPKVSTITVQPEEVTLTTELPGRTSAYRVAEIRPQVSGLVQKRLFEEGSEVKAGQVLYQIDPAPFEATLDNAIANHLAAVKAVDRARAALKSSIADVARSKVTHDLALTNRKRYEDSYKEKVVSAIQLDQAVTTEKETDAALHSAEAFVESNRQAVAAAQAAVKQAEAALKTARINLGYCKVTAPISGRIGKSNITEGAVVTAYQQPALATIQQLDPIYVDVPQSTSELLRLRKSSLNREGADQREVKLILDDGAPYGHTGTLQFSDVTVDPTTGSVDLRVVVPNPRGLLLPGMFVQAVIKEGVSEKAILVPQQGVSRDQKGNPYALTVGKEGKVAYRPLKVDRAIGDKWLVGGGLALGDKVIVEGLMMLRPGATVKEVPFKQLDGITTASAGKPAAE